MCAEAKDIASTLNFDSEMGAVKVFRAWQAHQRCGERCKVREHGYGRKLDIADHNDSRVSTDGHSLCIRLNLHDERPSA